MINNTPYLFNRKGHRTRDVWATLERNWSFFFWLTGETPPTLQLIVDRIQLNLLPQMHRGHAPLIDFRKQVIFFGELFYH